MNTTQDDMQQEATDAELHRRAELRDYEARNFLHLIAADVNVDPALRAVLARQQPADGAAS